MQLWKAWKEAAHDYLFDEEVKNLFQSSSNSTEQSPSNRDEIYETKSDDEHIMQNLLELREFKIYVESLNDFLLGIKLGDNVPPALQWPKVNKWQRLKSGSVCRWSRPWELHCKMPSCVARCALL